MARLLKLLALFAITLRAHGTPVDAAPAAKSSYCANFDDLPQNTASSGGFDPSTDPVGTYKGITYQGFVIATQKNSDSKFFHIPSQPNIAHSATDSRTLYGGTSALIINATATGGAKDTFTLTSLRIACLVTNGIYVGNPNGCTVLFVGNKRNGDPSVTYEYEYPNQNTNPGPGVPLADFGTVTFPKNFNGLTEVFIQNTVVQNDVVGSDPLLDDVCLSIQAS